MLRRWVLWVTTAEVIGFAAPSLVATAFLDRTPWGLPLVVAAGAVEGAVLGAAQATVLRDRLPGLDRTAWVWRTAVAASFAWTVGLGVQATWPVWQDWPPVVQVVAGAVAALALLGSLGTAQWTELRRHVPRAGRWIVITAVAWLIGLTAFLGLATPLWHEGQPPVQILAVGLAAGLLMALTMALVTGLGVRRLAP